MKPFKSFPALLISIFISSLLFSQTKNLDYRDADRLFSEEKWEEAASAYLALATENPYNGYYWSNYAYCLYTLKEYDKAIDNFKKATDVGYFIPENLYNIACCYSLMNKPDEAIEWLEKSARYKFRNLERSVINDGDFNTIRSTNVFKKDIIPSQDMFKDRITGWKIDIDFMKKRMEQTHYDLFANITKDEWDKMFDNLQNKIDQLDDSHIITELLKITSKVGDGHTTVFPQVIGKMKANVLPVAFHLFEDGLFITAASPEYSDLAGKKVTKLGNEEAENLINRIKEVAPIDNEFGLKWIGMTLLGNADVLFGLGIIPDREEAEITVEADLEVTVKAVPMTDEFYHLNTEFPAWIKGRDTLRTPLYLRNQNDYYWYEYLPQQKLVYMQLNAVASKKEEPLSEFSKKVFDFVKSNDVEYFVLDIRLNNGGNSFLNKSLVQEIIKCDKINQMEKFFTIIGRNTFSAAMNLSNDIERQTNVIFVGEPTGSKPNFVGETNIILLPYSGLSVSCSSRYWQNYLSDDYRKWIAPQLGVKYYSDDYKNGIDPAMDEIIKFINKGAN